MLFVFLFWVLYTSFCSNTSCKEFAISQEQFIQFIQVAFPVYGIVNSLRLGLVYRLNDRDDEPESIFYISLGGLAMLYTLIGLFFSDFLARSQRSGSESSIFIITLLLFVVTVGSLLADRQTWDKSTFFVRWRVVLSLIHVIILLINPITGLMLSCVLVPAGVLAYGGLVQAPDSDQTESDE